MQPGDIAIYRTDPLLYGKLLILEHRDTKLLCEQVHPDSHGDYARELFDPSELEHADTWTKATA